MPERLYRGKRIDEWLGTCPSGSFPARTDCPSLLVTLRDYLAREVYHQIGVGALWRDGSTTPDDKVFLTDHGVDHVEQVITRANALLHTAGNEITPYETYLLLVAICLHDVGNIFGRRNHETSGLDGAFRAIGNRIGDDRLERRIIRNVVTAHGGHAPDGSRDTIGKLPEFETLLGQRVRVRALAGLLRLADELAEDRTRASRFLLEKGDLGGSEVHHAYANALVSVEIERSQVLLSFEMAKDEALRQYRKGSDAQYLLDEIFLRTIKMHRERIYCMRFLRSLIAVDRILVTVRVYDRIEQDFLSALPVEEVSYTLEESGYPDNVADSIRELCPTIETDSGRALAERLSSLGKPER